jgi:phage FluMu protein Com
LPRCKGVVFPNKYMAKGEHTTQRAKEEQTTQWAKEEE